MFHDHAKIYVEGGGGGRGAVSFRREAHVPRGGPDGGDGGNGGDVVLVADSSRRDLASMRISRHYRADRGGHGEGSNRHGARGEDEIVLVPPGTTINGLDGERFDLVEEGQRAVVAHGGKGGHGNKRFASATQQAPRFAEKGLGGQEGWIELRLRLLADAGLVGLPNAGKSSLLARITRAAPKVGDYPFTTLAPVLGTLDVGERQLVLADIPGLIEGAAAGAGLGHEFLAHVERCRVLVHLLELGPHADPADAYRTVRGEIAAYGEGLAELPELVVFSKADLLPEGELEAEMEIWQEELGIEGAYAISSATGYGLDRLQEDLTTALPADATDATTADDELDGFEAEYRIYSPPSSGGYEVTEVAPGSFEVGGRGIEMLVERHDLGNHEAVSYLERRLKEIGVLKALRSAGFEDGDEVVIGEHAFELHI